MARDDRGESRQPHTQTVDRPEGRGHADRSFEVPTRDLKLPKTEVMISAAAVTTRALLVIPRVIAAAGSWWWT